MEILIARGGVSGGRSSFSGSRSFSTGSHSTGSVGTKSYSTGSRSTSSSTSTHSTGSRTTAPKVSSPRTSTGVTNHYYNNSYHGGYGSGFGFWDFMLFNSLFNHGYGQPVVVQGDGSVPVAYRPYNTFDYILSGVFWLVLISIAIAILVAFWRSLTD